MRYKTILNKVVFLTQEREKHILERHPDITPHFSKIRKVLLDPDEVRVDRQDPEVLLFYKRFSTIGRKYLVVVIKANRRSFILTCYISNRIRTGEKYDYEKST